MNLRHTFLASFLLASAAGVTVPACAAYCDAPCYPGFHLSLVASEGLAPGEYTLEFGFEGQTHGLTCTVLADGTGECVDGDTTSDFRVGGHVYRDDDGLDRIHVSVDNGYDLPGPGMVEVEVTLADEVVGTGDYEPKYEREPLCNCLGASPETLVLDLD